jgi:hypothetical protein
MVLRKRSVDRDIPLAIGNWQRTTGVNPWVNAQIKNLICSLFKCHGREPVGLYSHCFIRKQITVFRL